MDALKNEMLHLKWLSFQYILIQRGCSLHLADILTYSTDASNLLSDILFAYNDNSVKTTFCYHQLT